MSIRHKHYPGHTGGTEEETAAGLAGAVIVPFLAATLVIGLIIGLLMWSPWSPGTRDVTPQPVAEQSHGDTNIRGDIRVPQSPLDDNVSGNTYAAS